MTTTEKTVAGPSFDYSGSVTFGDFVDIPWSASGSGT
jgi:hypothetical protein